MAEQNQHNQVSRAKTRNVKDAKTNEISLLSLPSVVELASPCGGAGACEGWQAMFW